MTHPESEWRTRKRRIDPRLDAAGWALPPRGVRPLREPFRTEEEEETANGPAGYALWLDGHVAGVVEAKITRSPQGVLTQAERYARGLPSGPYDFAGLRRAAFVTERTLLAAPLTDPEPGHAFVYVCTIQRMAINLFGKAAAHTTSYFQHLVYRYDYRQAVSDGYLVDYDVVKIAGWSAPRCARPGGRLDRARRDPDRGDRGLPARDQQPREHPARHRAAREDGVRGQLAA